MSKIGMVILNYNDYETTFDMINQIKDYKVLDHIVIVDNHSTDLKYDKLKKLKSNNIDVIQTDKNKGYAYGNNYGIKYLNDNYNVDYIIISNPDILVNEKCIISLKEDLDKNKNISIIAPVVNQLGEKLRGWKLPRYSDELLSNINYIHRIAAKRTLYPNEYYNEKLTKVEVVSGCFFMARKIDFEKIGYFDAGTFLYYEENIIGKKLKDINKDTYIDNEVSIIHNLSVSVNKSFSSIKKYKILKESQKYYEKKYNNLNIFKMILLRLLYYISLGVAYIVCIFKSIKNK